MAITLLFQHRELSRFQLISLNTIKKQLNQQSFSLYRNGCSNQRCSMY